MLSSKQRAFLRSMANTMDPIMQVGKSGVGEELITSVDNALEARELIKMSALETAPVTAREAADELAEATGADVVAVVGRRFVLYRPSKKKKKIELPK
ncbi:MAG: ribosome assembly RNA-binding protein YhbY [Clostridia bacterium]|nr:ribosome assembly RNA-binding protein YhbY [Clostridia bacterium]MBQ5886187.1 ribosome assembly RNA-binding protein YhbY [Clostridia bacterium]MBQ7334070.1 ribosome assembly RNA-binding protein YhbY [Clostridia bacterium]